MISNISLSSQDRTNNSISESDFTYRLPFPIKNITKLVVDKVCVPKTWYTVMVDINDTIVTEASSTKYTATLNPGVYSASQLATEAQNQIRNSFTPNNDHSVSLNTTTYKYTIANTTTSHTINWSESTANKLFGFTKSDTSSGNTHVAPNIYDLSYSNKIYIISNLAVGNSFIGSLSKKILFSKTIKEDFGELSTYENEGQMWEHFYGNSKDLYELDFKLIFEDGKTVPLNGVEWSITMRFIEK